MDPLVHPQRRLLGRTTVAQLKTLGAPSRAHILEGLRIIAIVHRTRSHALPQVHTISAANTHTSLRRRSLNVSFVLQNELYWVVDVFRVSEPATQTKNFEFRT